MEWLNNRPGLESTVKRLSCHKHGRLCLHGLPDSDKIALPKCLFKRLDSKLTDVHTSGMLDKFAGGTEENSGCLLK